MPALAPTTIAGLANRAGVDVETVRQCERLGLLPGPRRQPGRSGILGYNNEHLERLAFIRRAAELGFSIQATGELLAISGGLRTCGDAYQIAERQLSDIRRRIAELSRMEAALAALAETCPRSGSARDCPV